MRYLLGVLLVFGVGFDGQASTSSITEESFSLLASTARITDGPKAKTNQREAVFSFSSKAGGTTFQCSIDGGSYVACSSPHRYGDLSEGTHRLLVRVGEQDGEPASYSWSIDVSAPVVTILSPLEGDVLDVSVLSVKGKVSKPYAAVRVFVNDKSAGQEILADENGLWTRVSTLHLENGRYAVSAEATDQFGNVSLRASGGTFSIKRVYPETSIVDFPARTSGSRLAAFAFKSSSEGSTFECQFDDSPGFTPCAEEYFLTKLSDGVHLLRVRAKDAGGNVDPTPAEYQWTVNTQLPSAPEIKTPQQGDVVDSENPLISGKADSLALVSIFIDGKKVGVVQADESGNWSFRSTEALSEGTHQLMAEVGGALSSAQRSAEHSFDVSLGGCASAGAQPTLAFSLLGSVLLLAARRRRV